MAIHTLALFIGATFLVAVVPGPNVLLTISCAIRYGLLRTLTVVLGLATAAALYLAISVIGLKALIATSPMALTAIQWLGACYLLYIGLRLVAAAIRSKNSHSPAPIAVTRSSLFLQGFWTSFSNPKTLLYWSAFLPQFLQSNSESTAEMAILGAIGIVFEMFVLGSYASIAAVAGRFAVSARGNRILDVLAGSFLAALGVTMGWNLIKKAG